jgi:hypothetical protein
VLEIEVENTFSHAFLENERLYAKWLLKAPRSANGFEKYCPDPDDAAALAVAEHVKERLFGRSSGTPAPEMEVGWRFESACTGDFLPDPPIPAFYQYRSKMCAWLLVCSLAYELDMIQEARRRGICRKRLEATWDCQLSATRTKIKPKVRVHDNGGEYFTTLEAAESDHE